MVCPPPTEGANPTGPRRRPSSPDGRPRPGGPPPAKARVLVVEDHPLMRERLAEIINQEPDLQVCGEAEDRAGALALAATTRPDLAVVDLTLKGSHGLELLKDFRVRHPRLAVLVISLHEEGVYAERALRDGARGYICKDQPSQAVRQAIHAVLRGDFYFTEQIKQQLLARAAGRAPAASVPLVDGLADRELEVLRLIGAGCPTDQIAAQLHLATSTIETYRGRIRQKLQLTAPGDLLRFAIRWSQSDQVA